MFDLKISEFRAFLKVKIESGDHRYIIGRNSSGLVFSPNGVSRYVQNGKTYISDKNHVLYLPEGGKYEIFCDRGDSCFMLNFKLITPHESIESFEYQGSDALIYDFDKVSAECRFSADENKYREISYYYTVIAKLTRQREVKELPEILLPAIEYIKDNFALCDITNDKIAKSANLSTVYFRKLFTSAVGTSPMKYVKDVRIKLAKELLSSKLYSVSQVAEACGFASVFSFCRCFKNETSISPGAYSSQPHSGG